MNKIMYAIITVNENTLIAPNIEFVACTFNTIGDLNLYEFSEKINHKSCVFVYPGCGEIGEYDVVPIKNNSQIHRKVR